MHWNSRVWHRREREEKRKKGEVENDNASVERVGLPIIRVCTDDWVK